MFPLKDNVPSRSFPLVTWTIILLNGMAFLYELMLPEGELEHFVALVGMVPAQLSREPWMAWTRLVPSRPTKPTCLHQCSPYRSIPGRPASSCHASARRPPALTDGASPTRARLPEPTHLV